MYHDRIQSLILNTINVQIIDINKNFVIKVGVGGLFENIINIIF
jgi:hypothetical protein